MHEVGSIEVVQSHKVLIHFYESNVRNTHFSSNWENIVLKLFRKTTRIMEMTMAWGINKECL